MSPIGFAFVSTSLLVSAPASPFMLTLTVMPEVFWKSAHSALSTAHESWVTSVTVGPPGAFSPPPTSEQPASVIAASPSAASRAVPVKFSSRGRSAREVARSASLHRHDPDQVLTVESSPALLSARLHRTPVAHPELTLRFGVVGTTMDGMVALLTDDQVTEALGRRPQWQ